MASPFRLQPSGRTRTALLDDAGRGVVAQAIANAFFDDAADPFSPADLWHTGQWIAPYALGTWRGQYSAGPSRDVDLTEATNPPTVGAALNGYATAAFDGATTRLLQGLPASSFFGASAGTIAVLFYGQNTGTYATPAGGFQEPSLVCSIGNWWALTHSASGCRAIIDDGAVKSVTVAASLNGWHLAIMRWDGTTLGLSIDGGTEVTVACGAPGDLSDSFRVGTSYATAEFFNGRMGAIFTRPTKATTAENSSLLAWVNARFGLTLGATGFIMSMVGLPARARGGVSALSLGGLTVASKGLPARSRGGVSQLATSLALAGVGLPPVRRGGVSSLATSLALSGVGLPSATRGGVSSLALGVVTLASVGLPTRTTGGSSAITIGGITLSAKGLPASTRGGSSALATSLALVMVGLPTSKRAGTSALSTSLVLSGVGLPSQLRAGSSVLSPGSLALVGVGLPSATQGGAATLTLGVSVTTLVSVGLPAQLRAGVATLTLGPVTVAGQGLPTKTRGGSSTSTPGALALASKGLPAQLRAGVAASLPVFLVAARGLPARARAGVSQLGLGSLTMSLSGLPAMRSGGVATLAGGALSIVSLGLPARLRAGVGVLGIRAENQAADLDLIHAPFTCIGLELSPFSTLELPVSPFVVVDLTAAPLAALALEHSPLAVVTIHPEHQMQKPYRYDVGDDAVFLATFTLTETGELADPTTLEVTVRPPTSSSYVVTYPAATLERKSLGVYRLAVDCTEPGVWEVVWKSTGAAKAAEKASWTVL